MRFFFYGTLMAGSDNPPARLVAAKLRLLGPATVRGALHAVPDPLGWYPALLSGDGTVGGLLYELRGTFTAADLARLDAYEDYDPERPGLSLYQRRAMPVTGPNEAQGPAETYVFAQPLPADSRPIPGGDFRAWLAEHGFAAFREGAGPQ